MKTKQVPIVVNGGLDTKSNPKLVKPGAALQIDNMYQQRPGEWRPRNGMTTQAATFRSITGGSNLYASANGVSSVARGLNNGGVLPQAVPVRYGARGTGQLGWECANGSTPNRAYPFPSYTCLTESLFGDGSTDQSDGDIAILGTLQLTSSFCNNIPIPSASFPSYKIFDGATGRVADYASFGPTSQRPPVACSTANFLVLVVTVTSASPYSIQLIVMSAGGGITSYTPASLSGVVFTTKPYVDVTANPGTDTIAIAYNASSGGISCAVVDVSTGTVTVGPTNYAAFQGDRCLAWLNTAAFSSGQATLATAGSTAGLKHRLINVTNLVAGADISDDPTATSGITQITGHWDSATQLTILYMMVNNDTTLNQVFRARFTGTTAIVTLAPTFSIYSRTAKGADGRWYFVGAYTSPVQSSYALLTVDDYPAAVGTDTRTAMMCQVMAQEGGGQRSFASSLANLIPSGSQFVTTLPRKKRVTVAGVVASQGRIQQRATFTDALATMSRARELGGVVYLPGGAIYVDDGQSCRIGVFPRYPEAPFTFATAAGGSMTSGKTYGYRCVFKRQDNSGRVIRSAGSLPFDVTLGATDTQVTLSCDDPALALGDFGMYWNMELYRVGPIEDGAALYNLVGTAVYASGSTITFVDKMSDANAALGEAAYFTGNVEENEAPPSTGLLEVNAGRVWVVNAEDPTELWPSKQSKTGTVVGFTADWAFRVDGDGRGPITALGSLNSQLIVFKDESIWAISGNGPDDTGNGTFNPPQILSRETGVPAGLARSVVSTPDGLMFQSSRGIYLLGGAGLQYIGSPVEAYTQAANVVDASTVRGYNQARFVMASGRCLVWDYQTKQWSTFVLPVGGSSVVACVDTVAGWYYLTADGKLRMEVAGATSDDGVGIVPVISLPYLAFAGLSGYQRLRALDILLDVMGGFTLSVDAEFNYSGSLTGQPKAISLTPGTPTVQVEYLPPEGLAKCASCRPVITVIGSPAGGSFRLTSVTAVVGVKSGTNIPASRRLT